MSKSNATELDFLNYTFKATAFPWNAVTNLDLHLHTADPGEAGLTTTSEGTYTSYALVQVSRSGTGWTVSSPGGVGTCSNAGIIQFPQCTGGTNTITHVSVAPAGSTQILYSGALNSPLAVANLVQPQFSIGALVFQED